jgi:acetylornithine deacetylase/succinyl-diaminopimelate desuccinylase-like protein
VAVVNEQTVESAKQAVLEAVDRERVLALEQECVRIPSDTYEEQKVADLFASYMEGIGLEVEMLDVVDPFGSGKSSRQPVGILRGVGGGPSLMLNGHMDHNPVVGDWERDPFSGDFEDGFVYGRGCQDDKGGIVSAISTAEALLKSGVRLTGDVVVCPVVAHKAGGIGTRALLERGITTDYAINTENSGNGLAIVTVGALKGKLHAYAPRTHAHSKPERLARYVNRIEQLMRVIEKVGPAERRIAEDGWLTYESCADLPDFPIIHFDRVDDAPLEGRTTLEFHLRTVPGMTRESVVADLDRVIAAVKEDVPNADLRLEVPPKSGKYGPGWDWPPVKIELDDPLAQAMIAAHKRVTGEEPVVGAEPRLGAVGDASFLQPAGVKTVLYGPGDIRIFKVWPTPDERVTLDELVVAAKVYALAAIDVCGLA